MVLWLFVMVLSENMVQGLQGYVACFYAWAEIHEKLAATLHRNYEKWLFTE